LIVDAKSVESIRNGLRILIEDKSLYIRLARNGIGAARETFNWKTMEKRLLSMYSTLEAYV
jgi:glycosyltransferase involved in cell wall biosynthesis